MATPGAPSDVGAGRTEVSPALSSRVGSFPFLHRRAAVDERLEPGEGVLSRGAAELAAYHEHPAAGAQRRSDPWQPGLHGGARDEWQGKIGDVEAHVVGE